MKHRLAVIVPAYVLMYAACYYIAYLLRFDFAIPAATQGLFWSTLLHVLTIKCVACVATGEWRLSYRYSTIRDVIRTAANVSIATAALYMLSQNDLLYLPRRIPRSVMLIDGVLVLLASGGLRMALRVYTEMFQPIFRRGQSRERAVIYCSDRNAISILRAIDAGQTKYKIVGFVNATSTKRSSLLAGLPVFPSDLDWKLVQRRLNAKHVLIPSTVPGRTIRDVVSICALAELQAHVIPGVDEIVDGRYQLKVRDVTINDLLRREPAQLDMDGIRHFIAGRRVLVTGGAGSIGSELCRQISTFGPAELLIIDQSEFGIFTFEQELLRRGKRASAARFIIADICDEETMERIFGEFQPQVVFHAAAYKHVPLMEANPQIAIRNNIGGTKIVADLAHQFGVENFVMISTDKAVRPTSVMGATKFIAEKYLQGRSADSETKYATVRFGNVLDSAGSVVPTFRQQIENGGPLTVTHPDIERFFMTIPEAVQLVLQAGAVGNSGDVLILEMGQPVRIFDLARDMISLSGLSYPDDIDIVFTGLRPGEKLYEELFYDSEEGARKIHDKIFCASRQQTPFLEIYRDVAHLLTISKDNATDAAALLRETVDRYISEEPAPVLQIRAAA